MGSCFCASGTGGDQCERGVLRVKPCEDEVVRAYGEERTGLLRHAALDVCAFYDEAYGVTRVDKRRWKDAQEWESALWARAPSTQITDRNVHHKLQFAEYSALPSDLGHVVELGCGPFTQLQTILSTGSHVESITLVDPLVNFYAKSTKGCTYKQGTLNGMHVKTLAVAAEELQLQHSADTLVLISVLQGVHDVFRVLQTAFNALRVGGLLVFADRVFDGRWDAYVEATRKRGTPPAAGKESEGGADIFWDVGHPCTPKQLVLDHFLSGFEELYLKRFTKPSSRPGHPADDQLYFIGRKLRSH